MIPIAKPLLGDEERDAVWTVMQSGQVAQGPVVAEFERAFAQMCGVRYAIATSSGTTALHLALLAHGIGPGHEVITSPFTFIASANSILHTGARPVFVDVEEDTFNLDATQIEAAITPRTKALMPIHLFGLPCDMGAIMDIAARHGLAVIEDACQAHGATYAGQAAGSFGTGCFSFYATKNITTAEGGMITTNDEAIAERARLLRNHGMRQRYYHEELGYNFRMTDLQAAIGLVQLRKLAQFNAARIRHATLLSERLADVVTIPTVPPGRQHVFHQYTVRIAHDRDGVAAKLNAAGVGTGIFYPVPVHQQAPYLALGYGNHRFPVAERLSREVLSLPVHPALTPVDLETIVREVRRALSA